MAVETRIDLLRHGETAGGRRLRGARRDDPLSRHGWRQLERATAAIADWTVVATSDQRRCRDFGTTLAARLGCDHRVDGRLREYDFGDWDGRELADLWREDGERLAAFLGNPGAVTPPGGEHAADFRVRVRVAWDDLLAAHRGRPVLVIGHGGVLRQLVADVLGGGAAVPAALDWPHAAMSRVRVVDDPPRPRHQSLLWHARTVDPEAPC